MLSVSALADEGEKRRIEIMERQKGKEYAASGFDPQRMTGDGMYIICG